MTKKHHIIMPSPSMCSKSNFILLKMFKDTVSFNMSHKNQNKVTRMFSIINTTKLVFDGQKLGIVFKARTRIYLNTNCVSCQEFMVSLLCWTSFCKKTSLHNDFVHNSFTCVHHDEP
jgi:hypothetical protein